MATAFSRQFDTGIPFHQPPRVPTRALPFNISVPRLPRDKNPTEDPATETSRSGRGASGSADAGAAAGAGAGTGVRAGSRMGALSGAESLTTPEFGPAAGVSNAPGLASDRSPSVTHGVGAGAVATHPAPSFWDRVTEPFNPNSGLNQGFKHNLDVARHTVAHEADNVFSPSASWRQSGWNQDIQKVMNFGNPFPAGSPGGPPAPTTSTGSSSVRSAVGEPQNGLSGYSQGSGFKAPTSWSNVGSDLEELLKIGSEAAK